MNTSIDCHTYIIYDNNFKLQVAFWFYWGKNNGKNEKKSDVQKYLVVSDFMGKNEDFIKNIPTYMD